MDQSAESAQHQPEVVFTLISTFWSVRCSNIKSNSSGMSNGCECTMNHRAALLKGCRERDGVIKAAGTLLCLPPTLFHIIQPFTQLLLTCEYRTKLVSSFQKQPSHLLMETVCECLSICACVLALMNMCIRCKKLCESVAVLIKIIHSPALLIASIYLP